MTSVSRIPAILPDERGFALIELLVAMSISTVVIAALVVILEFSLHQETNITDKVQADQIGRTVMGNIVEELHSSCTGFEAAAIQAPSETPSSPLAATGATNLWFVSAYGKEKSGEPLVEKVTEHDINWEAKTKSNTGEELGTLTDYEFSDSAGNAKEGWTFPSLKTTNSKARTLAKNVIPPQITEGTKKVSTLFQYYKYNTTSGELEQLKSSTEIAAAASAKEIAKVTVSFTQAPTDEDTRTGRSASFSDSVAFRFTPTESGTEGSNSPCE
jgi:prepilin-type N-terminal cleavage/methylation domain-containing protein